MIRRTSAEKLDKLRERFRRLYDEELAERCLDRLAMMVGRYGVGVYGRDYYGYWDQGDIILITYGDAVRDRKRPPLPVLREFLSARLKGAVSTVHLLPFFPYSSDDGFSVIDYRTVNPDLGTWEDVKELGEDFILMFDLVLNHVSRRSDWFKDFLAGIAPARDYFLDVDPAIDLSRVVRPRSTPLLTKVQAKAGERHLWTTFSDDQMDLNFSNPDVLFEFLDILLLYISMGARILRLDAIAYLWKDVNTTCIHLPETHEIVKLMRDFVEMVRPSVRLLTETNVPQSENLSYFGAGDEAHMVYQFALPPLLLHTLVTGNASALTRWASAMPRVPVGCTFLNFTASHDGIGVRPLQGLIPDEEVERLIRHVQGCGGRVSTKANADGSESPYELNSTYYDALGMDAKDDSAEKRARFLCSQLVAMELQGVAAVYFESLVGGHNDEKGVRQSGRARSINRRKWDLRELSGWIDEAGSDGAAVFNEYVRSLRLRARHPAFHPRGGQRVPDLGDAFFAVERTSPDGRETMVCVSNVTSSAQRVPVDARLGVLQGQKSVEEVLTGNPSLDLREGIRLAPYQTVWLRLGK